MKITFEADTLPVIIDQMEDFISSIFPPEDGEGDLMRMPKMTEVMAKSIARMMRADIVSKQEKAAEPPTDKLPQKSAAKSAKIIPEIIPEPEEPKKVGGLGNAPAVADRMAKMRAARVAKRAARAAEAVENPVEKPVEKSVEERAQEIIDKPKPELAPAELVALRTKTIAELQKAYAGGKHQEVMELLSRFGNGAKSFRELQADAFVPIREAIELGALT